METISYTQSVKMKDDGFYDDHSQLQMAIINMTLPAIERVLSEMPLPLENVPFVIVDYGCSEGKNSVYVVDKIVNAICRRQKHQLFSVVFNDLPQNNFNKLFENIYKWQTGFIEKSNNKNSILTFASGLPFHMPVMSAQTVNFGYSASAAHWLTELPLSAIQSHIFVAGAIKSEKESLSVIAAQDWQKFLHARAAEMSPGARLVVTMAARLDDDFKKEALKMSIGHKQIYDHRTGPYEMCTAQVIMDLINDIIQELEKEKKITPEQARNICIPIYPRSLKEVLAPIENGLKEQFVVEQADIIQIGCPLFEQYLQTGDGAAYAQSVSETFRAFLETIFLHQLYGIGERRRVERLELVEQKIVDEIFNRMKVYVQSNPEYYNFFPIHSLLVLVKK